jgi:cytochrome c peroxidase
VPTWRAIRPSRRHSRSSACPICRYLVSGCPNPSAAGQPESFYTTDPGKALITGQCADFNGIEGPILCGLAARAPYFHNGAAADLNQLMNFYDQRFSMHPSEAQKSDLVAFLNSL